jgi:hypothetical protein
VCAAIYDFFRDQGSVIAGVLNRQIAAADEQTQVAQKQLATSLLIERRRVASEAWAFYVMLEAATGVVREDADAARKMLPNPEQQPSSQLAYWARQRIRKTSFTDLRSACLKLGGELTEPFLRLDNAIDDFASQWQPDPSTAGVPFRKGTHAEFIQQLEQIEGQAKHLLEAAGEARKQRLEALTAIEKGL